MHIDYQRIYRDRAPDYDRLVSAEDRDGNILSTVRPFLPAEARVVEVGAGTGRLTRVVAPFASRIFAVDVAPAMLAVARTRLATTELPRVAWAVADGRALPVPSRWADVAMAGWVFGHLTDWSGNGWTRDIAAAIDELCRAVRPGAQVIVLETLGTGTDQAGPPSSNLSDYYQWLEHDRGFTRRVIRTDYEFDSVAEAVSLTGFFFGDELATRLQRTQQRTLPEWTGVWTKRA